MADGSSKVRIKSAMVIYELERELGRYIRNHPHEIANSQTGKDILQRAGALDQASRIEQIGAIVENSS